MQTIKKILTVFSLLVLSVQTVYAEKNNEPAPVPVATSADVQPTQEMLDLWDLQNGIIVVDNDASSPKEIYIQLQDKNYITSNKNLGNNDAHQTIVPNANGKYILQFSQSTFLGDIVKRDAYTHFHLVINAFNSSVIAGVGSDYTITGLLPHKPFEDTKSYTQFQLVPLQDNTIEIDSTVHVAGKLTKVYHFAGNHFPIKENYSCYANLVDDSQTEHTFYTTKQAVCDYLYDATQADMPVIVQYAPSTISARQIVVIGPSSIGLGVAPVGLDGNVAKNIATKPYIANQGYLLSVVDFVFSFWTKEAAFEDSAVEENSANAATEEPTTEESAIDEVTADMGTKADSNITDKDGRTALFTACRDGHVETVENFLASKADINITDENGQTALFVATKYLKYDLVDVLLKNASLDPNIVDNHGFTALSQLTMRSADITMLLKLLKDSRIQDLPGNEGMTGFMHLIVRYNKILNPELIKAFLTAKNLDLKQVDNDGYTLFMYAILFNSPVVVKAILEEPILKSKIDINQLNNQGETAFMLAVRSCPELIPLLVKYK